MKTIDLRSFVIGGMIAVGGLLCFGGARPQPDIQKFDTIVARNLILQDAKGEAVGHFSATDEGRCQLHLGSPKSQWSADLSVGLDATDPVVLKLISPNGSITLSDGPFKDNGPTLWVVGPSGRVAAQLGVRGEHGQGFVRVDQNNGERGVAGKKVASNQTNGGTIRIVNAKGDILFDPLTANQPAEGTR